MNWFHVLKSISCLTLAAMAITACSSAAEEAPGVPSTYTTPAPSTQTPLPSSPVPSPTVESKVTVCHQAENEQVLTLCRQTEEQAGTGQTPARFILPVKHTWELHAENENVFPSFHKETKARSDWILLTSGPALGLMYKSLYKSDDKGNWSFVRDVDMDVEGYPTSISFRNDKQGWIGATYHSGSLVPLFRTLDGGLTWKVQTIPVPEGYRYGNAYAPVFSDKNDLDGTLSIDFVRDEGTDTLVYRTADGGETWARVEG